MAESFARAMEDELSCPICLDIFVEPKILPGCAHVCCEECLKQLVGKQRSLNCPECRKEIQITKDGIAELKTNFRLRNLAEKHPRDVARAMSKPRGTDRPAMCTAHTGENMHCLCVTCNVLVCQLCVLEKHAGASHDIVGVKARYKKQTSELETIMSQTRSKIQKGKEAAERIKQQIIALNDSQEREEEKINQFIQQQIDEIIEHGKTLRAKLKQDGDLRQTYVRQQLASVEQEIRMAETVRDSVANTRATAPECKYIMQHDSLTDKLTTLSLEIPDISIFQPLPKFVRDVTDNMKGSIVVSSPTRTRRKKLVLAQKFGKFGCADSLTLFPSGIIAVCELKKIVLYCKQNSYYKEKCQINTASSRNDEYPSDIATCSTGQLLVARTTDIEVYTSEGIYKRTISTLASDQSHLSNSIDVCSVTTTSDGRILAGDCKRSVITLHDPTGNIIKTMEARNKPGRLTVIRDTNVAMIGSDCVSIMNINSGLEVLNFRIMHPAGAITYDEATGCLLISRMAEIGSRGNFKLGTGVIEQYCSVKGELIARLAEGLHRPFDMTITSDGQLAVLDAQTVKVYQLS